MLRLNNVKVPAEKGECALWQTVADMTGASSIRDGVILKKSVDARKKNFVFLIYSVAFSCDSESELLKKNKSLSVYSPAGGFDFPFRNMSSTQTVTVVGMGPAGLFAAYCLCMSGLKVRILERGCPVEQRKADIDRFWEKGELNENSNVQFGEGGAGTFSDGKLTTGITDERIDFVNRTFVELGAPGDILYLAKPHIGTDMLRCVIRNMREKLLGMGCEIYFETVMNDLMLENGRVVGVSALCCGQPVEFLSDAVVLCPGNSARDTFTMLRKRGAAVSAKSFSVGVRIEHLQKDVDVAQYGQAATLGTLPHSDYKLAVHLPSGRSVYTFCVCPGGYVVAAASEKGGVVTNGMSEYARNNTNICGGLLVSVTPEDFAESPEKAVAFQRELEKSAYTFGGGDYRAPAQLVGDFIKKRSSKGAKKVIPSYKPGVKWGNLWECLPEFVCSALAEALPLMGKKIHGFDSPDAVLTAVETRSSCPVRIERQNGQAIGLPGLFPAGEGAGYAGGIMSAAVDGIHAAEAVCQMLTEAEYSNIKHDNIILC